MKESYRYFTSSRPDHSFVMEFWVEVLHVNGKLVVSRGINREQIDIFTYKTKNKWFYNKLEEFNEFLEREHLKFNEETDYIVSDIKMGAYKWLY